MSKRSAPMTLATIAPGMGTLKANPITSSARIVSVEKGQFVNSHSARRSTFVVGS
ncbi:MAG TPA: hypothetical protein VH277_10180 [Gemmatimonadaceae bacterium]|nr:hypothetical protein [Gemmatimonadaceae bacterium]